MPEQYEPKRKAYLLSDAKRDGMLVRIRCNYHKIQRWYVPDDLRQIFGDIDVDSIMRRMRCDQCRNFVDVKGEILSATERRTIRVRRLERMRYVARPVWRDDAPKGWTIQSLVEANMTVTAQCRGCHHSDMLDLEVLRVRLGSDADAMADDLSPKLKCSKCGGKRLGLIYAPNTPHHAQADRID